MAIALDKIEQVAPDQSSLDAALKLRKPTLWPTLGCDDSGLLWGECQGSGAAPYRIIVDETDLGYKCTCPSRKFPCKHSLALMLMRAENKPPFASGARPNWVDDWLARRRRSGGAPAAADKPTASLAAADSSPPEEKVPDAKAEARSAAQRTRQRADREAAIAGGLDELDVWLADQLARGLAGFPAQAEQQCRLAAQRLVDAKAPGLANRVEQLLALLFATPESERPDILTAELASLHLIAEAYRRQSELAEPLRADLRQIVGWPVTKESLLEDGSALRVNGRWMVMAAINEVQPDKLRRLETWLSRLDGQEGPHYAVLIDFVPVAAGAVTSLYAAGETIDAELVFYPSAVPLRALIARQSGTPAITERWPSPPDDLAAALERYDDALAARPWLGDWPLAVRGARVVAADGTLWLSDATGATGVPLEPREDDTGVPLIGLENIDAFGLWDGRALALKLAETSLGRWTDS